ncbi:outer membrane lipoprotein chaperone LolA [Avibacterium paragallinarum]|uniref:Outer-membrane lipoprotein carrier protein n=1 Tax=Avibacterium paragallinarum TaxID=728 RepID=A0AAE5TKD2_AVIPA|nr:outer membrane lipoprotein chaperone LolA [Avibacterium paragallinarum]MEE3608067.1 outer membrane lipoprotein chaperone LolA [Avibacterium paragallinarum]MEE3621019.1 outer membrane lipoprotein chaperone LolA [Avibacterium paragallinarum]MEE3668253.1 outer membrane lipoprotein chaperone LolA [Avibacterium paragallinarum]MEE3680532.1 outer membrane lipoprotein chaperone LolA [Avibacterium paragallinarum]MEE4385614.1 outer membrane lipoprotein chaperone LolA [Avibacterium paragallinarum]
MKKMAVKMTALLCLGLSPLAWADAVSELQARLNKVEALSADYVQKVSDPKGKEIQQGKGKIQIKRPNLFRMDNQAPQESQVISDGKTLWFYDPFVQQVTANWVADAVNNTPFVLLTSNDTQYWKQYNVEQNADTFTLKPKSAKSQIKQFDIRIDGEGVLKNFSTTEKDGQTNLYLLRNITNQPLANSLFKFSVPKGVELDDQRKKK